MTLFDYYCLLNFVLSALVVLRSSFVQSSSWGSERVVFFVT